MLTDDQINQLRKELLQLKKELTKRTAGMEDELHASLGQESVGELSNYDNHPADQGTELFEREKDIALHDHAQENLEEVEAALKAIDESTYGICEICGEKIPFERLEAVPATNRCINHPEQKAVYNHRPVEEDALSPGFDKNNQSETAFDAEDSWQGVSRYGTSESPSDFEEAKLDYNDMYMEASEEIGVVESIEDIATANLKGNFSGVNMKRHEEEKE